jgi:hypothetical protein
MSCDVNRLLFTIFMTSSFKVIPLILCIEVINAVPISVVKTLRKILPIDFTCVAYYHWTCHRHPTSGLAVYLFIPVNKMSRWEKCGVQSVVELNASIFCVQCCNVMVKQISQSPVVSFILHVAKIQNNSVERGMNSKRTTESKRLIFTAQRTCRTFLIPERRRSFHY